MYFIWFQTDGILMNGEIFSCFSFIGMLYLYVAVYYIVENHFDRHMILVRHPAGAKPPVG